VKEMLKALFISVEQAVAAVVLHKDTDAKELKVESEMLICMFLLPKTKGLD
jgi:hypothetical protein